MDYVSEYLRKEIPAKAANKFIWLFEWIELDGNIAFSELLLNRCIRKLGGKYNLYEFRVQEGTSYRIIFGKEGSRLICSHGFIKKSQKTPKKEIETAIKRLKPHIWTNQN